MDNLRIIDNALLEQRSAAQDTNASYTFEGTASYRFCNIN